MAVTFVPEPTYRQKEPEEMVRLATEIIGNWDSSGANLPPVFMPDFGTVTLAKPWGGKVVKTTDGQIFIQHVSDNIDRILDIEPGPNPDMELSVQLYREVCSRTGRDDIRFVTPDFQGVLGTAAQIMEQSELMVAMYTEPEKIHKFLDLVCRRNIQFMKDLRARVHVDGNCWPYIWLPQEIGLVVTEDQMPLLSPELYKEFGLPYLKRTSDELGPVFIHSCGNWIHNAKVMAESGIPYLGVDNCYPYTRIEDVQEQMPGLVIQPGFEFFNKYEYEDVADYLQAAIGKRRGNTCLWMAANSNPIWKCDKLKQVLDKAGIAFDGFCK